MKEPTLQDRVALWTLRLAKWQKARYEPTCATNFYQDYFKRAHIEAHRRDVRHVLRRQEIAKWLERSKPTGIVVDVGCGVGDVLEVFGRSFVRVGTDYSPSHLRYAKSSLGGQVHLAQASAYELPFRDGAADIMVCLEVIEHLEHDTLALREIGRVLKPGGYLVVAVPSHYYWPEYLDLMGHWRHYSSNSLRSLLATAGLCTVSTLRQHKRLQSLYMPVYMLLRAASLLIGCLTQRSVSVYSLHLPGRKKALYDFVAEWFMRMSVTQSADNAEEGATFLVAQKTEVRSGSEPVRHDERDMDAERQVQVPELPTLERLSRR